MKYLLIFIIPLFLFAFEVEYTKFYQTTIFPNQKAILLETNKPIQIDYKSKIYTKQGIVLINYNDADEFVRNDLYFNGKIKDVKVAFLNLDNIRFNLIREIKMTYKTCKIKKIIFKNEIFKKVFFKPTNLIIEAKIILNCK